MPPNLLVVKSMTKFYASAGLRLGFCAGSPSVIDKLRAFQTPWPLGSAQIECGIFLCTNTENYAEQSRIYVQKLKQHFRRILLDSFPELYSIPSEAPYFLIRNDTSVPLAERLLIEKHICVRDCGNYPGLSSPRWIRVVVRKEQDQDRLFQALHQILHPSQKVLEKTLKFPAVMRKKKTPALMLQGTCSNAGKSILTAAFCRILLQDGYQAAPFKAQNMALNSGVTADGLEMGRAQILQAEACRLDPDVRMNPILLKPSSETGSQVIVSGKPVGNMRVREYFSRKRELFETVKASYDSLSSEVDAMILEGAGSPGEINLKKSDIVNMRMAEYAQAPVLLVGDIDRGGVYASFLGTYGTFEPWERDLLKGFIVNKFRGDPSLLSSAHEDMLRYTGKPVVGVVDYLKDLILPEEDSVNFSWIHPVPKLDQTIDCVLIAFPHISNFTDFTPLELEADVILRKIHSAEEFGNPDLILLPGSKSVASDMEFLRETHLDEKILQAASQGTSIAGICGGMQLMGLLVQDPYGIESAPGAETAGLGLLPLVTQLQKEKILRQTVLEFRHHLLRGYEIHHGESSLNGKAISAEDCMTGPDGRLLGIQKSHLFACYLHGIFDDDAFRRIFLNEVRLRSGLQALPGDRTASYNPEISLNRLADHVRERINMKQIYRWMGLK